VGLMRRPAFTVVFILALGALLTGCGSSSSDTAKTYPAYGAPQFKFTVAGDKVTVSYIKAPPSAAKITLICANLGDKGFTDKLTGSGTWQPPSKSLAVTMPGKVGNRDLCAAQLGSATSTVVAFLNPKAQQKYLADQKKAAAAGQQTTPGTSPGTSPKTATQ